MTAARTTRDKNIATDTGVLTNLISELSTHTVSFTSKYYYAGGILSDTIWKKQRIEGASSDFPLVRIEQYYSLIALYNKYYPAAMKISEWQNHQSQPKPANASNETDDATVLEIFELFKEKYGQLERLLFVNLQYDLGNLTNLTISPLSMNYPRISKPLLNVFVDLKVLDKDSILKRLIEMSSSRKNQDKTAEALPHGVENAEALKILKELAERTSEDKDKYIVDAFKKAQGNSDELQALQKKANDNPTDTEIQNALKKEKDDSQPPKVLRQLAKKNLKAFLAEKKAENAIEANATALIYPRKENYKDKIKKDGLSPRKLKKASQLIYRGGSTQLFLAYMENCFSKKYDELREIALRLPFLSSTADSGQQKPSTDSQIKGTFTIGLQDANKDKSQDATTGNQQNGKKSDKSEDFQI
jgi:hypothetical protein